MVMKQTGLPFISDTSEMFFFNLGFGHCLFVLNDHSNRCLNGYQTFDRRLASLTPRYQVCVRGCVCTHIAVGTVPPSYAGWRGHRLPAGTRFLATSLSAVWSRRGPWWRKCERRVTPELLGCWNGSLSRHLLSCSPGGRSPKKTIIPHFVYHRLKIFC